MTPAAELEHVTRNFRVSRRQRANSPVLAAVDDLSLTIQRGEVVALLGPNGAGKTTTVKMLATLLLPSHGSIRVFGLDAVREPQRARRRLGLILGGERGLYDRLSARDNLRYFATLYALPPRVAALRLDEVLEQVGLRGREHERVERYSRGMRQRLHIARGLLHDPALLLLDEPTIGIDPLGARNLRGIISRLRDDGKAVLLTTHYMHEAEQLSDRILVLSGGRLVAQGTASSLKQRYLTGMVVEGVSLGLSDSDLSELHGLSLVRSVDVTPEGAVQRLQVHIDPSTEHASAVEALLKNLGVTSLVVRQPTLEDAYITIVQRTGEIADVD